MLKKFNINNYSQLLKIENNKIEDALCNCRWGTLHTDHYKLGKKICRHLKQAILINGNRK